MRIVGSLITDMQSVPEKIRMLEEQAYDSAFTAEINNDPFLPALLAAEHSDNIEIMTSIAVAFARNPMSLANTANDLQAYSKGRFVLGIGSQVRAHITRRLSMPWSQPAARMREFIQAMRAIWACWSEGEKLNFEGEFYQHTLMTPMFTPPAHGFGAPKVKLAAVGPLMTEVAAEVADGMIAHGFSTESYMRDVTLPAVEKGLARSGRSRQDFDICCPVIAVTGVDEESFKQSLEAVRMQLAFYASTPGYNGVLEHHGWGDLHEVLNPMSRQGKWLEMGEQITDEILQTFAVVCENPADLPAALKQRCDGLVDSWQCTVELTDAEQQRGLVEAVRG